MRGPDAADVRRSASLLALVPQPPAPRKSGRNRWQVRCPFHGEDKAPSMSVSFIDAGWVYRCFACHAHGDVIRYVMELERVPFREAIERLAGNSVAPAVPLWTPPKRRTFVIPCMGSRCMSVLELDERDVPAVDVRHPSWGFVGRGPAMLAMCPRCRLEHGRPNRPGIPKPGARFGARVAV